MAKATHYQPKPFHSVTPALVVNDAAAAIEFYKKAMGAEEISRMPSPDGRVMHAELRIGDSVIMLSDEFDFGVPKSPHTLGGTTMGLMVYVPDVDAAVQRAVDAGATVTMPVTDMFWGDRYGKVLDPFGHDWGIATHTEDLTIDEMTERQRAMFEQMPK